MNDFKESLGRTAVRGGAVTLGSQGLITVVRTVGLLVLARLVTPQTFGLVAIVTAITAICTSVIVMGLVAAGTQATRMTQPAKSALFFINTAMGAVAAVALYVAAHPLASAYASPRLEHVTHWLALVPLLSGFQAQHRVELIRKLRFVSLSAVELVAQVASLGISLGLAYANHPLTAILTQVMLPVAFQAVVLPIVSRWMPTAPGSWPEVKDLVRIGANIFGANLLNNLGRTALVPIIGLQVNAAQVGSFDRAQQLAVTPISLTIEQLQRVSIPVLSQLRDDPQRMGAYMLAAQRVCLYTTATIYLLLSAVGPDLITVLMGTRWHTAGQVFQILTFGFAFRALGQAMNWCFIASGQTKAGLRFSLWTQPAILLVSIAGLPWGVVGVAVANTLAWAAYWPVACVVSARASRFSPRPFLTEASIIMATYCLPAAIVAGIVAHLQKEAFAACCFGFATGLGSLVVLAVCNKRVRGDLTRARNRARGLSHSFGRRPARPSA